MCYAKHTGMFSDGQEAAQKGGPSFSGSTAHRTFFEFVAFVVLACLRALAGDVARQDGARAGAWGF